MIYVIGHKNPDTDSIASAVGYAWLHQERDGEDTQAARAGSINAQSRFALNHFGVESPILLEDASPRFSVIARKVDTLPPQAPLADAWQLYAKNDHPVPVIDDQRNPIGMVTGQSVFRYLSRHLEMASAPFKQLIDVPCVDACDRDVPSFNTNDRIIDMRENLIRNRREYFWGLDTSGKYVGMCTRADMMNPPRIKLILVDHNESTQAVNGLAHADLLEVLDHHRLGNTNTTMPISFYVDVVGSCSTLISERMRLARLTPPPGIAGMLLSGIISDTLMFKSPTTTQRDRASALWLAWIAFGVDDAESKMHKYGEELLIAGADLSGRSAQDLVTADFKAFEAGKFKFGVSQIEVTSFSSVSERLGDIRAALRAIQSQRGLDFAAIMITDIVQNNSQLLFAEDARAFGAVPYARIGDGLYDMPGVVSRKKQLLPALLAMVQG
jgi:manganese-dependent inorganic pyrophosphatase